MKYSVVAAIAAFAGVAQAQSACLASAAAIPPCALGYLADAAASISSCGIVDFQCQCSVSMQVQNAIAGSVAQACGGGELQTVLAAASNLCACASSNSGQTISLTGQNSACEPSAAAIPACALGYLASAASQIGGCALDDFVCQCQNSASVQNAVAGTLASACGASVGNVLSSASALCACATSGGSSGPTGGSSANPTGSTAPTGSAPTTGSTAPTTAAPTGSAGPTHVSFSTFTGGAPVVGVFGGAFGAVIGLLALL